MIFPLTPRAVIIAALFLKLNLTLQKMRYIGNTPKVPKFGKINLQVRVRP